MKACVVIPTYNEKKNIPKLIDILMDVFKSIKSYEMHVLFVDDNSPDGTADTIRAYAKTHSNIHLITGEKNGLGAAYIRGFNHVKDDFDAVMEMDADLSHDPKTIPLFLREIQNGFDFVIGSRYIEGGETPDWDLSRKAISRGGNFFARIVSGLYKVHDCTSGFRAIRTSLLKKVNFDYLASKGYAFQITLLYELFMSGANVKEIPIIFNDRKFGESKLSKKDIIEFFLNSYRLRLRTWERFAKFATIGSIGVIANTFLLWMLTTVFGLYYLASGAIAIELSIILNYILNDSYTFRDNIGTSSYFSRMVKFNGVALYGFLINLSILYLLTAYTGLNYLLSNLAGIFAATVWNYFAVLDYTWRVKSTVYYPKRSMFQVSKAKAVQ